MTDAPSAPVSVHIFEVDASLAGERLDRVLARRIEGSSRSKLASLIRQGHVRVAGREVRRPAFRVETGQCVRVEVPPPPPAHLVAQAIPLDVVYEDEDILVVDKPAGMVVHPAPGHPDGTLANAIAGRGGPVGPGGAPLRPGIVHRLDRGTSGLLVVARTEAAFAALSAAIRERRVTRRYVAVVLGTPMQDEGTFDTLYGRHPRDRVRFSSRVRHGKRAVTHWRVVARGALAAVVAVELETGRTHQIRVHFADARHPVVGDALYGRQPPPAARSRWGAEWAAIQRMRRPALHAARLAFAHPTQGRRMCFFAPLPPDVAALVEAVAGREGLAATEAFVRSGDDDLP